MTYSIYVNNKLAKVIYKPVGYIFFQVSPYLIYCFVYKLQGAEVLL